MRIATWNLDCRRAGRADLTRMTDLIRREDLDVLLLQEVRAGDMPVLSANTDDAVCSLDVQRTDGHTSGQVGVAVLVRKGVRLDVGTADLLYGLHQPERGLSVTATWQGRPLSLLSWHAPNAAQHGRGAKAQAYVAVQTLWQSWTGLGIAGIDSNFPEDPVDLRAAEAIDQRPEWRFQWDLLGPNPRHPLVDVTRQLLSVEPVDIPDAGPIATTHRAGARNVRFDRLLVTPGITPHAVRHLYDDGIAAGSDHAMVCADVRLDG